MPTTVDAKNEMLDGLAVNYIRLHSGDPTGTGGVAVIAGTETGCTYAAAAAGARDLTAALTGIAIPSSTTVSHFSLWQGDPTVSGTLKAYKAFDSSEVYTNAGTATVNSAQFTLADAV